MIKYHRKREKSRALGKGLPQCLRDRRVYSFNVISGCPMECNYCKYRARDQERTDHVFVYTGLAKQLSRELDKLEGTDRFPTMVLFDTISDAFFSNTLVDRIARDCLDVLLSRGIFVNLSTKGLIPAEVIEVMARKPEMIMVTYSISSLSESFQRVFEPRVPSALDRLRMVKRLADARIPVRGRIEPLIPMENDTPGQVEQLLALFRKNGVREVVTSYLQMDQAVAERLKQRTGRMQFSMVASWYRDVDGHLVQQLDRDYRRKKYEELKQLGEKHGVRVIVCACRNLDMFSGRCFLVPADMSSRPRSLL